MGFLVTTQQKNSIPFLVRRVFWVYNVPSLVVRGQHAHKTTNMVLICLQGTVSIEVENVDGVKQDFHLATPQQGLYLPAMYWSRISLEPSSILLSLASSDYEEEDYIRDYNFFKSLGTGANSK